MALVKMVRNEPRVAGGNTEGMFDEALVADLKKLGWKLAERGAEKEESKKDEPKKEEPKKDEPKTEPKVEPKVEPVKDEPKADEKKEDKVEKTFKK